MKPTKMPGGAGAFVKELATGLLAALLFTLGLPDSVGAARAILTQGNLRLFLWLALNETTFVPSTFLKTTVHMEGSHEHEADVADTVSFARSHLGLDDGLVHVVQGGQTG
jgi:hypothetical protein